MIRETTTKIQQKHPKSSSLLPRSWGKKKDEKISKKSFKTMMKACYPGANVDKLTKHIWRMYDANNDGSIDFRELMMVLYIMSDGTPEQNLKQIFKIFDLNNDGKINQEEMNKITKDLSKLF